MYADFSQPNDEASPVAQLGDLPDDVVTEESYGPLKALCEGAVQDVFGERALIVRPGLIVGPHDPTGRFTYWPHRVARGGEVLAPAPPDEPTQIIDVRDLGEWIVSLCERRVGGVFNATHPGVSWRELLETCLSVAGTDATITWVDRDFLVEQEVGEWMELPLWLADPCIRVRRPGRREPCARGGVELPAVGRDRPGHARRRQTTDAAGLKPQREAELLRAWHGRG